MEEINWYEVIKITIAVIGGSLALYQFYSQTNYARTKNLTEVWRKFYETPEFMKLFSLLDDSKLDHEVSQASSEIKLRFLAYLSEVYCLASISQVDTKKAILLFQWHYYYTFIDDSKKINFWGNILNTNNIKEIDSELQKKYWKPYYDFALKCKNHLKSNGDI